MFGVPLFGTLIILYLFLGGAAAGSLFTMSAWSLVFHRDRDRHEYRLQKAFKSLMSKCYIISFILLIFSVLCLIWDLGAPERMLLLFLRPHFTVLTFGSYILLIQLFIALLLAAANGLDLPIINGCARKVFEILCCIFSLAVMVYTGVFLASNVSVPFWNTWTLVALFLFSSLSAGVSIVLLIDYFIKDKTLLLRAARPLQKMHVAWLGLEALTLTAFLWLAFTNTRAERSIELLTSPEMLSVIAIGIVGMGIVVPLFLETYNLATRPYRTIPLSDVVCLFGGLCLRYVIIQCGVH